MTTYFQAGFYQYPFVNNTEIYIIIHEPLIYIADSLDIILTAQCLELETVGVSAGFYRRR